MDKANKQIMIVLHEIYGKNKFIEGIIQQFMNAGFDVFCPNMIGKPPFPYEVEQKAYDYFVNNVAFDVYKEISKEIDQLKEKYEKVFVIGFSVGATVAWRCCENLSCDGIVACYGSRIRDYTNLNPVCPMLLLFAKEDSFDVDFVVRQLQGKPHLQILEFAAKHGFLDPYTKNFDKLASKVAEKSIRNFLSNL